MRKACARGNSNTSARIEVEKYMSSRIGVGKHISDRIEVEKYMTKARRVGDGKVQL